MQALRDSGQVTKVFRHAVQASAWRPAGDPAQNPPGTHCDALAWENGKFGAGILDVAALLEVPLDVPVARALTVGEPDQLPLFASLYPEGTDPGVVMADYQRLFGASQRPTPEKLYRFETELLYHYTVDEGVRLSIDAMLDGRRGDEPAERIRDALRNTDVSSRLRQAIAQ